MIAPSAADAATVPQYSVTRQIAMPAQGSGLAVDPSRGLLYVAAQAANEVLVYDESTLTVKATIRVPDQPDKLAVGPTGVLYVSESAGNALAVILPGATTIAATLPTGSVPSGVTVSHDGTRLWVANSGVNYLSVFNITDPAHPAALPNFPTTLLPQSVTESPDGTRLAVASAVLGVSLVNATTRATQATWGTPSYQATFTTDGSHAIVASPSGAAITVYSTGGSAATGTIPGSYSFYQSQDTSLGVTFVTLPYAATGSVAIINSDSATLAQTLPGVSGAYAIATDSATHDTFVTSITGKTLTEIGPSRLNITEQPQSQTISDGQTATFTSATKLGTAPVAVKWQSSTDNGATWSDIADATGTSYTTPAMPYDQSGTLYRAVFTDAIGLTATTNAATLTVTPIAPTTTQSPASQSAAPGDKVTFTAAATGTKPVTVQWQVSSDGGTTWTDIPAATSDSYTIEAAEADNSNQYRAVFTNPGGTATTDAATLTVTAAEASSTSTPTPTPTSSSAAPASSAPSPTASSSSPTASNLALTGTKVPTLLWASAALAVLLGAALVILFARRVRSETR